MALNYLFLLVVGFALTGYCWGSSLSTLQAAVTALPQPVAYYPLTLQFGLTDGSGNAFDGTYSPTYVSSVQGPFAILDTAMETGFLPSDNTYMIFANPAFNFTGSTSWTMALFVNMQGSTGPILEYYVSTAVYGANLWQYPTVGTLYGTVGGAGGVSDTVPCTMTTWQFVALIYDGPTKVLKVFCDTVMSAGVTTIIPPYTSGTIMAAYRVVGTPAAVNAQFACIGVYAAALNTSQLAQVRQLCQQFETVITCSANCASCRANLTNSIGYSCDTCLSGWTDYDCNTYTCSPSCANGGTCTGPNTCHCATFWAGPTCTSFYCSPVCAHSGTCIGPNNCKCSGSWTGTSCNTPICSPPCQNGGNCTSPNVCRCPSGWTGAVCTTPICSPGCTGGRACIAPNLCSSSIGISQCLLINADISSPLCVSWQQQGQCLTNPAYMWTSCQISCTSYATCECSTLAPVVADLFCYCGEWASSGYCETDFLGAAQNCSFTCGRRLSTSNYCSPLPLNANLPASAKWHLSSPGPASFGSNAAYLQSAVMVCNPGFAAADPDENGLYVCDPFTPNATTGNWFQVNANPPNCTPVICPDPPILPNSYYVNYTTASNYYYGDLVTYYCEPGYVMSAAKVPEANCTLSGSSRWSWADKKPVCSLPPCGQLVSGINAYYDVSANQTGGIANYECLLGYNPSVNRTLFLKTCQSNGIWMPPGQPVCDVVICPPPKAEENAYLTGTKTTTYYYGDVVTVYCKKGSASLYTDPKNELIPLQSVTNYCTEFGKWSTNTLSCLLNQCPSPQPYEISAYHSLNTTTQLSNLLFGMTIAFECDYTQGYEPIDNQTDKIADWYCNENSTWDKEPLHCQQSALLKKIGNAVKQEAYDSTTAVAMGTTVLCILAFFLGMVVCLDYLTVARDLKRLKHNINHMIKRFRDKGRVEELHFVRKKIRNEVMRRDKLKKIDEEKETMQMALAGMAKVDVLDMNALSVVANPLLVQSNGLTRPVSADAVHQRPDHIEADMDLPEDIDLRLGITPSQEHTHHHRIGQHNEPTKVQRPITARY